LKSHPFFPPVFPPPQNVRFSAPFTLFPFSWRSFSPQMWVGGSNPHSLLRSEESLSVLLVPLGCPFFFPRQEIEGLLFPPSPGIVTPTPFSLPLSFRKQSRLPPFSPFLQENKRRSFFFGAENQRGESSFLPFQEWMPRNRPSLSLVTGREVGSRNPTVLFFPFLIRRRDLFSPSLVGRESSISGGLQLFSFSPLFLPLSRSAQLSSPPQSDQTGPGFFFSPPRPTACKEYCSPCPPPHSCPLRKQACFHQGGLSSCWDIHHRQHTPSSPARLPIGSRPGPTRDVLSPLSLFLFLRHCSPLPPVLEHLPTFVAEW